MNLTTKWTMLKEGSTCWFLLGVLVVGIQGATPEQEVRDFLAEYDQKAKVVSNEESEADWAYATNITDYNSEVSVRSIYYMYTPHKQTMSFRVKE